jgi:hypothetical protein
VLTEAPSKRLVILEERMPTQVIYLADQRVDGFAERGTIPREDVSTPVVTWAAHVHGAIFAGDLEPVSADAPTGARLDVVKRAHIDTPGARRAATAAYRRRAASAAPSSRGTRLASPPHASSCPGRDLGRRAAPSAFSEALLRGLPRDVQGGTDYRPRVTSRPGRPNRIAEAPFAVRKLHLGGDDVSAGRSITPRVRRRVHPIQAGVVEVVHRTHHRLR